MNKRYSIFGAALAVLALSLCSCDSASDTSSYWYGTQTDGDRNSDAAPTSSTELKVDYGENVADAALAVVNFSQTVYIDLTNSKYSLDNSTWNVISTDSENPSAVTTNVTIYNDSGYIKIDTSGTADPLKFVLSGTLSSGELFFANKKNSVIVLAREKN